MNLTVAKSYLSGRFNETVEDLERELLKLPQVDMPVEESFTEDNYTRQILIKAGTRLTGCVWLDDYVDIMVYGHILVGTPDGVVELKGFNKLDGKAGRKRIGIAIEDTLWITVHHLAVGRCKDALNRLSVRSMQDYYDKINKESQLDFNSKFADVAHIIHEQSVFEGDRMDLNLGIVEVKDSPIHGKGLFATTDFKAGAIIMPANLKGFRTEAGRYVNHGVKPNSRMIILESNILLQATKDIKPGEELINDYMHTIETVRGGLKCLEQ